MTEIESQSKREQVREDSIRSACGTMCCAPANQEKASVEGEANQEDKMGKHVFTEGEGRSRDKKSEIKVLEDNETQLNATLTRNHRAENAL
eukprot:2538421-Pleurochrysis_carterae.AAC.1